MTEATEAKTVHCPHCKRELGQVCEWHGKPAVKVGGLIFRQRFRAYCVVCQKPRHWRPGNHKEE